MTKQQRQLSYIIAFATYALLATALTLLIYKDQKNSHDLRINTQLKHGIDSMLSLLPEGLHQNALKGTLLPYEGEREIAYTLGQLAQSLELDYLYTLVLTNDDRIQFVISSPSPEEMLGSEYESAYLTDYGELDANLRPYFESDQDHFLEYSDRWGEFRSVFRPVRTKSGDIFLVGADINIAEVNKALQSSVTKSILMLGLMFIVSFPLLLIAHLSHRRQLKAEIAAMYRDPLTGLENRAALVRDIEKTAHPQLMLLNILRFSDINNAFGHAQGDRVLARFSKHLAHFSHAQINNHRAYRLHGDEFALLIDQEDIPAEADALYSDFLSHISSFEYKVSDDDIVHIKIATGVVIGKQEDHITLAQIALKTAMERALPLVTYSDSLPEATHYQENLKQLKTLRAAIKEKRLVSWFQPIFDTESLQIKRYEALARIVDKNGVVLSMPQDFLPVAYRYQIYYKVTRAIIDHCIEVASNNECLISINLSITDIEHKGTREYIYKRVQQSGVGRKISFELLESEAIHEIDNVLRFFARLKKLGCRLGIDDLGKEYSNFDRIMALPLDFIKLDGAIIRHLSENKESFGIISKIVQLAHEKNVSVTAEMVASEAQLKIAKELGCNLAQGYYLGMPQAGLAVMADATLDNLAV